MALHRDNASSLWNSIILLHLMICWSCVLTSTSTNHQVVQLKNNVRPKRLTCHQVQTRLKTSNVSLVCPETSETHNNDSHLYFGIESSENTFYLQLKLSDDFLAPAFNIEEKVGDLYSRSLGDADVRKCFYEGNIVNDKKSRIALNVCGGLYGAIMRSMEDLFITPLHTTTSVEGEHVLFVPEKSSQRNADYLGRCGTSESSDETKVRVMHNYKLGTDNGGHVELLPIRSHRQRRALSVKRYVETMVVADDSMFAFYGRNEIELRRYILSVMAIVTSVMKDNSIGNFVDVAVIKLIILKKNPASLRVNGDASSSLKRFCKWQKRQNKLNDDHPEHFDTAILLTRKDICSSSCDTLGLAELGTACDPYRSCSIIEDNGLSSAFTIAHELGHLLNAPHDGDHNECNDINSGKNHIMTPTLNIRSKTWTWSACSRRAITSYLESSRAECLLDKPSPKFEHPLPLKLPGEMFTLREQCQLVYGENSTVCPLFGRCSRLWCIQYRNGKKSCQTNNMQWADGTKCGAKSWCVRGICKKKEKFSLIHGQWGSWSAFDGCSRTCGGGVKYATRRCNKPKPAYNGNYCIGPRHKYKSCNTQKCPPSNISFRAVQCNSFNGKDLEIPGIVAGIQWLPKIEDNEEDICKLFCEVKGYKGIYYELSPKVIDGTKCRKGQNDICVDGQCMHAGCDNVLNSKARVDNCGVCNGDNSTCRTYVGYKNKTHTGYNFVAHIPPGASRLHVQQESMKKGKHDTNFLALLTHEKRYIFNGEWTVSLGHRKYAAGGTTIYYSGPNAEIETIRIPSTLKLGVEIQVLSTVSSKNCNIRYSYNFPVSGEQKYRWSVRKKWSECFPICKGFQLKEYQCEREIDSQVVSSSKCPGRRPESKHRPCNQDCDLKWRVYPSECVPLGICGNGVQEQKVECMMVYKTKSHKENKVVTHKDCHKAKIGRKPAAEVPCYSPCSTVRWVYSSWSECNQSCGGGMQFRDATCVMQAGNSTIPSDDCKNDTRGLVAKSCSTHDCPKWYTAAWSGACSVTCGHGVVERVVYCTILGQTVKDDSCNNMTKPDTTRPCIMGSCAAWKVNAWSQCSKSCGTGQQIREVYCETGHGEKVDDLECEAAFKPLNRQQCFTISCELQLISNSDVPNESDALQNVKWLVGSWKACSKSCEGGIRRRDIACVSSDNDVNNAIVSDDNCDDALKPAIEEICNTFSCPFWRYGAWSKCTKPCDNGTQTRLVLCGYNGTIVRNDLCNISKKPDERQFCNTKLCKVSEEEEEEESNQSESYFQHWITSNWSECSTTCGIGVKTRNVSCIDKVNCKGVEKPIAVAGCDAGFCPGWNYGQWTPCINEMDCGIGWQARLVICQTVHGEPLGDDSCAADYRPVSNRSCDMGSCEKNAEWITTSWQPCNVPCGSGLQFRYVSCEDKQGNALPEKKCLKFKEKPVEEKVCIREACAVWFADEWEMCDSSCMQRREVQCLRGGDRVDDTLCKLESRPPEERECGGENCVRDPVFKWLVGEWEPCSTTCGYSLRSRTVNCVNNQDRAINETHCSHLNEKPKDRELCFDGPCPPKWMIEPWSECSVSCGSGVQHRRVYCMGLNGANLTHSACPFNRDMSTTRRCERGKCGEFYRWVTGPWAECSRTCGIGETRRITYCVDDKNVTQENTKCARKHQPTNMKVCNIHQCPSSSCGELQKNWGLNTDGEQTLLLGNQSLRVYCEGMHRNNPKEFITLKAQSKENVAEVYGKRLRNWKVCPNDGRRQIPCLNCIDYRASGVTFFKKVRIDIKRMVIIPEDRTFADRFGQNPPAFATAGDCYSKASCPQGRFIVNFMGTGLRIADNVTWTSRGYHTSQKIYRSRKGQVIHGKCGGYCGMCSPSKDFGLKVEIINR